MDKAIKVMLDDHETRLRKLEKKQPSLEAKKTKLITKDYSGLSGGIRLLIKNGFFKSPKSANEIKNELKREGYQNKIAPISKALSVNFTKKQKILSRIRDGNIWKYILRK